MLSVQKTLHDVLCYSVWRCFVLLWQGAVSRGSFESAVHLARAGSCLCQTKGKAFGLSFEACLVMARRREVQLSYLKLASSREGQVQHSSEIIKVQFSTLLNGDPDSEGFP